MSFRISGQKIKIFLKTKYLGIIFDENLTFKNHLGNLPSCKNQILHKATVTTHKLLCNLRVTFEIWLPNFESNQKQCCKKYVNLHNNTPCIINFKGRRTEATSLYKDSKIMPLRHIVMFNNCLFLYVHLQNLLPKKFKNHFSLTSEQHQYLTRGSRINIPTIKTTKYGSYSLTLKAIKQWNTIQNSLKFDTNHPGLTRPKFQNLIINYINSL